MYWQQSYSWQEQAMPVFFSVEAVIFQTIQGFISSLPCLEGGRGILTCLGAFSLKSLARKCCCKPWQWECNLWLFCIVGQFVVFVFKPTCDFLRLALLQTLLIAVFVILEVLSFPYFSYMLISGFANMHLHFLSFLACGRKRCVPIACFLSGVLLIPQNIRSGHETIHW